MKIAPIVLFAYARRSHTQQTVEALQKNLLAAESDLIVYSDAARGPENQRAVDEVRRYLETIDGFRSVTINMRPHNFGLANSIIQGVTEVLERFDRVIVMEDDLVTSPYFLTYMNTALNYYTDDENVASVHGYICPIDTLLPETFFLIGADCWGWATWRRAWALFNPDGRFLLNEIKRRKLIREFDYNGASGYSEMLKDQIEGKNDSWAIRWHASAFLARKLTLYPNRSLVRNIGHDGSGRHCGPSANWDVELSMTPIRIGETPTVPSLDGFRAFERFYARRRSNTGRLIRSFVPSWILAPCIAVFRELVSPGVFGILTRMLRRL